MGKKIKISMKGFKFKSGFKLKAGIMLKKIGKAFDDKNHKTLGDI